MSKIGPLVHRDDSRFVSTDTALIVDQAVRIRLQDASAIASAKAKATQKELDVVIGCVWAVLEMTEGDPVLTGAVADALLSQPVVASASALSLSPSFSLSLSLSLSLCYSHTCQHSAISMRRRVILSCSKIHRRATLCDCGA